MWLIFDVGQYPLLYEVRISVVIRVNVEGIDTGLSFGEPWRVAREVTQRSDRNVLCRTVWYSSRRHGNFHHLSAGREFQVYVMGTPRLFMHLGLTAQQGARANTPTGHASCSVT